MYRRCMEDVDVDIETNTKVEMAEKMEGKQSGVELETRIVSTKNKRW